ncbi:hypothetical protein [Corynebacterium striatum]|uniref:hypothetical protein n=1 Tax=Corynebacterium striatum TaxID=43770 RepID=UPI001558EB7F|nr:hypothetical protein [Corynebacterium striatum]
MDVAYYQEKLEQLEGRLLSYAYATQDGDYVHGATRDGRFTLDVAAPVLIDPNQ